MRLIEIAAGMKQRDINLRALVPIESISLEAANIERSTPGTSWKRRKPRHMINTAIVPPVLSVESILLLFLAP